MRYTMKSGMQLIRENAGGKVYFKLEKCGGIDRSGPGDFSNVNLGYGGSQAGRELVRSSTGTNPLPKLITTYNP